MTHKGGLAHLAITGSCIEVRVTPGAAQNRVDDTGGEIRIWITVVPEGGKATKAAQKLLARALGVAPSRLGLIRGGKSKRKTFQLD